MMDFGEVERAVNDWLQNKPNFKLILPDESEKQLYFTINESENSDTQFYIRIPKSAGGNWVVGSDCDDQTFLEAAKALCVARSDLRVEELLNSISVSEAENLRKEAACGGYSDDEGEDLEYDDGYPDDDDDGDGDEPENSKSSAAVSLKNEEELSRYSHLGSHMATNRLLSDMKSLQASSGKYGISGCPRGDNLYIWDVKLTDFDPKTLLGQDLNSFAKKFKREAAVLLEMTFRDSYPMTPPFVRILRPRFKFLTGHVTIGGSICLQMLTHSGWSPSNDIESILIQIRSEIMSDPNTRLDLLADIEYSESEARDAFQRMVKKYNWN